MLSGSSSENSCSEEDEEEKRWSASEIVPGLWVGRIEDAGDKAALGEHNIQLVVSCHDEEQERPRRGTADGHEIAVEWLQLTCGDSASTDILCHFDQVAAKIAEFLPATEDDPPAPPRGGVLVHCLAGQSRSVSLAAAYLLAFRGHSLRELLQYDPATGCGAGLIQRQRPGAFPNRGFWRQLKAYEENLPAWRVLASGDRVGSYREDELPGSVDFDRAALDAIVQRFQRRRAR
jgi:protein-tyrosine phosphatase